MLPSLESRPFYGRAYLYLLLAFATILVGFAPSYFFRLSDWGVAHHAHGVTATLWMSLLVLQPFLYRRGYMRIHRMVGRFTLVLVPALILSGLYMVHHMMASLDRWPPGLPYTLAFIDFFVLIQFAAFYGLALKNVGNTPTHARYMVATVFGPLIPALTRIFFRILQLTSFMGALHISYVIVETVIVALIVHDARSGKVRLPYVLALAAMVVQHILMSFAGGWEWWRSLMDAFAAL